MEGHPACNGPQTRAIAPVNDNSSNPSPSNKSNTCVNAFRSWIFRQGSAETIDSASTMFERDPIVAPTISKGKNDQITRSGMDGSKEILTCQESEVSINEDGDVEERGAGDGCSNGKDLRGERAEGTSTFKVVASLVCVIAGTGTLGMPHAIAQSGWLGALIVVLALFMSTTTGNMVIKCLYLKTDQRRHSYQEIALDAYGPAGHYFAFGTVGVNLFGCAILYIILAATLIENMVRDMGNIFVPVYIYVMGCTFFVWVCLIFTKSMKEVALLSIVGALATIGVVMITVGVSADLILHKAAEVVAASHQLVDWSKMPLSLATIAFAYGGNVVYPHMEQSMKHPKSWSKALWLALSACFVMYIAIGVAGYLTFGSDTMSPVLKNLPRGAWSLIANSLITLHVLLAAPIILTSLAMMVESTIESRAPGFAQGTGRQQFLKRAIPRTIIILLTGFVASVIPFFGDVMDLLGALTTCLLVFVMPILFYYRLGGMKNDSLLKKLWAWFILVVGLVALVLGTFDATKHLISDFKQK